MTVSKLRLVVTSGRPLSAEMTPWTERVFFHWNSVWSETFKSLDGQGRLYSDDFTRQDEILALFNDLQCVAAICHRFSNMNSPAGRNDSYFRAWNENAIAGLIAHGPRVIVGSQISIEPEWRGRRDGISLKDLISMLSIWHLSRHTDIDAITGTMRTDKNMQTLLYACGAVSLEKNVLFHNVPVDLLAFHPQVREVTIPEEMRPVVEALWRDRRGESALERIAQQIKQKRTA